MSITTNAENAVSAYGEGFRAGQESERKRIVKAIESIRGTLWAYKSHEAMAMVLDDVLFAVDKDPELDG